MPMGKVRKHHGAPPDKGHAERRARGSASTIRSSEEKSRRPLNQSVSHEPLLSWLCIEAVAVLVYIVGNDCGRCDMRHNLGHWGVKSCADQRNHR